MEKDTSRAVSELLKCFENECQSPTSSLKSPEPSPIPVGKVKILVSKLEKGEQLIDIDETHVNGNNVDIKFSIENEERNDIQEEVSGRSSPADSEASGFFRFLPWVGSLNRGKKEKKKSSHFYSSSFETSQTPTSFTDPGGGGSTLNPYITEDKEDAVSGAESIHSGSVDYAQFVDSDDESLQNRETNQLRSESSSQESFFIAKELVTSEEAFIDSLRLLNVDFRTYIENDPIRVKFIPESDLKRILEHLPELQTLNEDLLLDLKERLENWETYPKIADVIVKKGPFLKIYSTYIQNFKAKTQFLDECIVKYPKFGKAIKEFEAQDRCRKLTLRHFMLKPVQRIPQYRLLFNNYLNRLSETSLDYEDTLTALRIVSEVADHVDKSMDHENKISPLIRLQTQLPDFQLIKPGRALIKHGALQKVCRKTIQERYIILLNDCLVYTTQSRSYLKFHQALSLSEMKVVVNKDDTNRFSFTIYGKTKSFILCAKSDAERNEWVTACHSAIRDYTNRRESFKNVQQPPLEVTKLGKSAPVWIQDNNVTMCQICTAEFTQFFRRHHCRSCGKVVCQNCSDNLAPLEYKDFKACRVCDLCFDVLKNEFDAYEARRLQESSEVSQEELVELLNTLKSKFHKSSIPDECKKPKFVHDRYREVAAQDSDSDMKGWLDWKTKKSWKHQWFVLKNYILYVYGACEDVKAVTTIPVLGYKVLRGGVNLDNVKNELAFQLTHPKQQPIVFRAESEDVADKWFQALEEASSLDV